jgi:LmbE family N-acetylglucosaminyl deacetylase
MRRRSLLAAVGIAAVSYPLAAYAETTPAKVLFVLAHPDDETISTSVAIAEHADAPNTEVHVLLLTHGEKSGVLAALNGTEINSWWGVAHDPTEEGYSLLTASDMAEARTWEAVTALRCLGNGITVHYGGLPDGGVTVEDAQAAILEVCQKINSGGPVRLKTHTDVTGLETHPDHLAAGRATRNLRALYPDRYSDVRYYVGPGYWQSSALVTVTHFWDDPSNVLITARARNAVNSYRAWAPMRGSYAIGYHSKSDWLDIIAKTPRCLVHS